jgi:hypothetical protein
MDGCHGMKSCLIQRRWGRTVSIPQSRTDDEGQRDGDRPDNPALTACDSLVETPGIRYSRVQIRRRSHPMTQDQDAVRTLQR